MSAPPQMINSINNYNDVMGQGNAREPHPNGVWFFSVEFDH
jgi:hypothetical protein